ncbi:MAG: type I-E CRISPR-associated protein Cse1/CasA [Arachnia sp.]
MGGSFNLVSEPWIAMRTAHGTIEEVSLRDAFHRAGDFQGLAGEIPTQQAAVLRLLLAIELRATARKRTEDEALRQWARWWQGEQLPLDEIDSYLDKHRDRFDLLEAHQPFMQVADLHTAKGGTSGLTKLIADVPAGHKFFTTRDGAGIQRLSLAEAARWLVYTHAFDISGIKSGAVGDDRVKRGKGYPIGIGISGWMGLVIAEGATLRETLLLNLVLPTDPTLDSAAWERDPHDAGEDWLHSQPTGTADLYTWQSRRVRLIQAGGQITDALVCNGDALGAQNLQALEPLSGWRYSKPQSKKLKQDVYMPRGHQTGRALWRGLEPLLIKTKPGAEWLRPPLLDWLAALRDADELGRDLPIRLRAIGVEYGSQSAVVASTIDDALPMSLAVVGEGALGQLAVDAAQAAQDSVIRLANLGSDLAKAAGTEETAEREHAFQAGYNALDPLFRRWFETLRSDTSPGLASSQWHTILRRSLTDVGAQLCRDAGEAAMRGRL